ncbi:MAG: hypothetical protein NDJ89_04145 [Oligoflexia bacterium]|nr:hypothetical protein [Oligoflexia bacterium]
MRTHSVGIVSVFFIFIALQGCSKAELSETTSTSLLIAAPAVAVTSPTASQTAALLSRSLPAALGDSTAAPSEVKPIDEMLSEIKNDLASANPVAIAAKVGNLTVTSYRASCYGPSWTDDATGAPVSRPPGDLGMVAANGSATDSTACAAAQLNALIGGAPQFLNKLVKLQATLIAALGKSGKTLPEVGATVDATADLPAFTAFTVGAASLKRLSDNADGQKVFKTSFSFTDGSGKSGSAVVFHTPKNESNSNFKGLIQAVLPHTSTFGAGTRRGLSMVYDETDGVLTYALDIAANRTTDSATFFNATSGRIDFSGAAFGEDGHRILARFDTVTNAVTMHYAWQAGDLDGAVRAFALNIPAGTDGSLSGVAYFGFGAAMSTLTDDVSTPWMSKMHCNWLNALASGPSVAKVQAQTFAQSGGKFLASTSKIAFAPTDNCNGNFSVTGSNPNTYDGSYTVATNDLVAVGDLGAIPAVTAPSYPVPTE